MKKMVPLIFTATILGCTAAKEVQMNLADVELVKIDTIKRYPFLTEKLLTWQDNNLVKYVTFVPMESYYPLGVRMKVMIRR